MPNLDTGWQVDGECCSWYDEVCRTDKGAAGDSSLGREMSWEP